MESNIGYSIHTLQYPDFSFQLKHGYNTIVNNFTFDSNEDELFSIGIAPNYLNTRNEVYLFPYMALILQTSKGTYTLQKNSAFSIEPLESDIYITVGNIKFYIFKNDLIEKQLLDILVSSLSQSSYKVPVILTESKRKESVLEGIKDTLKKYKESPNKDICPICLKLKPGTYALLECNHWYCYDCIMQWTERANICPMCKRGYSKISRVCNNIIVGETKVNPNECANVFICCVCHSIEDAEHMLICNECGVMCHAACNLQWASSGESWLCNACSEGG